MGANEVVVGLVGTAPGNGNPQQQRATLSSKDELVFGIPSNRAAHRDKQPMVGIKVDVDTTNMDISRQAKVAKKAAVQKPISAGESRNSAAISCSLGASFQPICSAGTLDFGTRIRKDTPFDEQSRGVASYIAVTSYPKGVTSYERVNKKSATAARKRNEVQPTTLKNEQNVEAVGQGVTV